VEGLKERIAKWQDTNRFGCRVLIKTTKIPVISVAWVRNFEGSGLSPLHIANNISEYLAFRRAYLLLKDT